MSQQFNDLVQELHAYAEVHGEKLISDTNLHNTVHESDYVKSITLAYGRFEDNPIENLLLEGDQLDEGVKDALIHGLMEYMAQTWSTFDDRIMNVENLNEMALGLIITGVYLGRVLEEHNVIRLAKAGDLELPGYTKTSS